MKNKMILWTAGMVSLVVVLMIIIVSLEPPKEGITRSQAFKAAALLTASRAECEAHQKAAGRSHFSAKEQGNWFVKYMDYLYDQGYLTEELTPANLTTAQGLLTYREASYLAARAGSSFKARVGANKHNQDSPYPEEDWWALYGAMAKELDPEGKILGGDACGMSTACEAVAANHMGMKICGISCISNLACGMTDQPLSHKEVQETADRVAPRFRELVTRAIGRMGSL